MPSTQTFVTHIASSREACIRRVTDQIASGDVCLAEESLRACLKRQTEDAEAWFLLGHVLHVQNRIEQALAAFREAYRQEPAQTEHVKAVAAMLVALQRSGEAALFLDGVLDREPDSADLWASSGAAWIEAGESSIALDRLDHALNLHKNHFDARLNRGFALRALGRFQEALTNDEQLVRAYVGSAAAHHNHGDALLCLRRFEEAGLAFNRALSIDSNHVRARMGLGIAMSMLRQYDQAEAEFARAERTDCAQAHAYLERAGQAIGLAKGRIPDTDPRMIYINGALLDLSTCVWHRRNELVGEVRKLLARGVLPVVRDRSLGFNILALPLTQKEQRGIARYVAATISVPGKCSTVVKKRQTRLRIGYLSPDFREHPSASNHWRQMQLHDRSRFEVIALSLHPGDGGPERSRIVAACDRFIELSFLENHEAIERIALEEIDILVDIAGYTEYTRPELLKARVAAINVQYMGTPGPCGGDFVDYRISDATMTPPEEETHWDEKLVWLPDSCWVCDDTAPVALPPMRTVCGLPEKGFVFCCFNKHYKIDADVFEVWMRLLRRTDGSVLWLLDDKPASVANLRREAQARGVASERIVFAPRVRIADHLGRHACADLFLDTLHYNAHTTAADALWAGLPVLTLPGQSMAARVGASLIKAAGLPELVARDIADYEEIACRLAAQPEELTMIRDRLVRSRSSCTLFDIKRRVRELEHAFLTMRERHLAELPPTSFHVPASMESCST